MMPPSGEVLIAKYDQKKIFSKIIAATIFIFVGLATIISIAIECIAMEYYVLNHIWRYVVVIIVVAAACLKISIGLGDYFYGVRSLYCRSGGAVILDGNFIQFVRGGRTRSIELAAIRQVNLKVANRINGDPIRIGIETIDGEKYIFRADLFIEGAECVAGKIRELVENNKS
jgi:hypothetical protein